MELPQGDGPAVLLVGHCGFDSGGLTRFAQKTLPGARVLRVNDQNTLTKLISETPCLLLINRVLDGSFTVGHGTALIEILGNESQNNTPSVSLLISNYEDAQQAAEQAGAASGFGKSDIGTPVAIERLQQAAAQL